MANKKSIGLMMRTKSGIARWFYFLPLFLSSIITAVEAENRRLCENCEWGYYSHPIVFPEGTKLCTLAFKKVYKPELKMCDMA